MNSFNHFIDTLFEGSGGQLAIRQTLVVITTYI